MVLWSHGRGLGATVVAMLAVNSMVVEDGGTLHITNIHDEWEMVPAEQTRAVERVRSAYVAWVPPTWDDPAERDGMSFAGIRALLTEDEWQTLDTQDGPSTDAELLMAVAAILDARS